MGLLESVVSKAPPLPSRVYFYAPEKWGKTSFAAHAPNPIFVMSEGETGLLSLLEAGRVPETPHFPNDCKTWEELQECVQAVLREKHDYKTLVLDTSNGCERLLSQHVCDTQFEGNWTGKEGYGGFGKGDLACVPHWMRFLQSLDEIRVKRRMLIVLLAHTKIKSVNNPSGPDYDQLRPEGIERLWTLTHKWADVIACGGFHLTIKDDKVKSSGGRVIHTTSTPAVVAGNRYGLPDQIQCGTSAQTAWQNFQNAVVKAKSAGRAPAAPAAQQPEPPKQPDPKPEPSPEPEPEPEAATWEHFDPAHPSNEQPASTQPRVPTHTAVNDLLAHIHAANMVWTTAIAQFGPAIGFEYEGQPRMTAMTEQQIAAMKQLLKPLLKSKPKLLA